MRVTVAGVGAVGARAARQVLSTSDVTTLALYDPDHAQVEAVAAALASPAVAVIDDPLAVACDALVLCGPSGTHVGWASTAVARGAHVVSSSDDVDDVRALLALDGSARAHNVSVTTGAAFAPGLACLLAVHGAAAFDEVDEVHIAKVGTGGPSCAEQHHRALAGTTDEWRDGEWVSRRSGSGRQLSWFPDPLGAEDCYRAATPDVLLTNRAFPGAVRITARMAANRRDRITAQFPMLRRPHPEGGIGAVRVELRGRRGTARAVQIYGAMDRPAVAGGTVAALTAVAAASGRLRRAGAGGVGELVEPLPMLNELAARGVKAATFDGVSV